MGLRERIERLERSLGKEQPQVVAVIRGPLYRGKEEQWTVKVEEKDLGTFRNVEEAQRVIEKRYGKNVLYVVLNLVSTKSER
jgi:hypothetical protein